MNSLSESLLSEGTAGNAAKMASWQRTIFFVTFVNYAMAHFSRKCYTNVKTDLVAAGVDKIILSQMDMAFMFTYAIGSFISGRLGDTFPQKCAVLSSTRAQRILQAPILLCLCARSVIIGLGLLGSLLCLGLIWFFQVIDIVNENYALGFFLFVFAQFLHGLFQSTGGPVNTSIMGNWFPKKGRGLIFGLWTCHQYVGDIISGLATAAIVNAGFAWQWALIVPAVANGVWGIVNFMFLPNSPAEVGIVTEEEKKAKAAASASGASTGGTISFMQALKIPNVMGYAIAFGFFKFVNYAMFFWLPFFLSIRASAGLDPSTSGSSLP